MAWYRVGTVNVTNNSNTVVGIGTAWVQAAAIGETFLGPDGGLYEITAINSNTSLLINPAYKGPTSTAQNYALMPTQGYLRDLAAEAAALVASYAAVRDGAGQGKFAAGTEALPSLRGAADENTGVRFAGSDVLQLITNGASRLQLSADGTPTGVTADKLRDRSTHTGTQSVATITGLGTAATKDVQTGPTDAIPGRLLAVGAFGIGGVNNTVSYDVNDFSPIPLGWSQCYLNSPVGIPGTENGYLTTYNAGSGYLHQEYVGVSSGVTYKRTVNPGAIGPWVLATTAASAVRSIASGGIIESGSNANGTYTKFADGTLICNGLVTIPETALYANFNSGWALPTAFVDTNYVVQYSVVSAGSAGSIVSAGDAIANGIVVQRLPHLAILEGYTYKFATEIVIFCITAIGRWK